MLAGQVWPLCLPRELLRDLASSQGQKQLCSFEAVSPQTVWARNSFFLLLSDRAVSHSRGAGTELCYGCCTVSLALREGSKSAFLNCQVWGISYLSCHLLPWLQKTGGCEFLCCPRVMRSLGSRKRNALRREYCEVPVQLRAYPCSFIWGDEVQPTLTLQELCFLESLCEHQTSNTEPFLQ